MNTCHFWKKAQSKTICILFSVGSQYYSWQSMGIDNWHQSAKEGSRCCNPSSFRSRRLLLGMQAVSTGCAGWIYVSIYRVWIFIWVKWGIQMNTTHRLIHIFFLIHLWRNSYENWFLFVWHFCVTLFLTSPLLRGKSDNSIMLQLFYLESLYLKIPFAVSQSFVNIMINLVKSLTLKLKLLYGESTNLNETDTNLRQILTKFEISFDT